MDPSDWGDTPMPDAGVGTPGDTLAPDAKRARGQRGGKHRASKTAWLMILGLLGRSVIYTVILG